MIPKIIWQTHEWEYKDLPAHLRQCTNTWKNLNTDWEYRYFSASDRNNYVKQFDNFYSYYNLIPAVYQADIWRYLIVHEYGGVYADMDSICTMPLNYMMDNYYNNEDSICTPIDYIMKMGRVNFDMPEEWVNNANFGSIKNSYILKETLKKIEDFYSIDDVLASNYKTGPGPKPFSDSVLQNKQLASFNFLASSHSEDYKLAFNPNYLINYNGIDMTYLDICIKYNLDI